MKKLCIFDLDGTLLNTLPTIAFYGNRALEEKGFAPICEERYKTLVGDGRDLLIHRMLCEHNADTAESYEAVGKLYDALYEADTMYLTEPYDGVDELLAALKKKGVRLAVLSNKPHNVAKPIVSRVFGDMFDEVWGKRDEYPVKPNPAAALEICRILGISPAETVFIGDTSVDIQTGKNAGFYTVGAEWGFRTADELKKAGADHIASTAAEVVNAFEK